MLVRTNFYTDYHPKVQQSKKTPHLAPHMKVGVCGAIISLNSHLNACKIQPDYFCAMLKMLLSQK